MKGKTTFYGQNISPVSRPTLYSLPTATQNRSSTTFIFNYRAQTMH